MATTIHERISEIVLQLGGGKNTAIASKLGVSEGNIRGYIKGVMPKQDVLEKIVINLDINPEWLLTGRGAMSKNENFTDFSGTASEKCINHVVPAKQIDDISEKPEAIPFAEAARNGLHPIPLVTRKAAAGFGNGDFSIEEADVKEYYVIPKFKYCHVDFMIEVSGLSMCPHFNPGDVIACSILRNTQFLQWNKCHVIATREQGILVKRLMPGEDKKHLRAISDNKEYPPFDIPVDEITGIAVVVGHVGLE